MLSYGEYKFVRIPLKGIAGEEMLSIVFENEEDRPLASFLLSIHERERYSEATKEEYMESATETCVIEFEEDATTIRKRYGDGAEYAVDTLFLWRLIEDWCAEKQKHRERERQKKKERVSLSFRFRNLAFPAGVASFVIDFFQSMDLDFLEDADYFSIDFEEGYEGLTVFLTFEAISFYPELYRAFTEVLERGSDYQKVVLNACSLEIRPDVTGIFDESVTGERKLHCEIDTKELFFFLLIWGDEWERRREVFWKDYDTLRKLGKKWEQDRQEGWEESIIGRIGKYFGKKTIKPKGYWEEWKKKLKIYVDGRDLGVYIKEVKTGETSGENVRSYAACFPKEMTPQTVQAVIQEAYNNKVCIVENSYMGRAKNGMKIAMFLNDAGEICKSFPLY